MDSRWLYDVRSADAFNVDCIHELIGTVNKWVKLPFSCDVRCKDCQLLMCSFCCVHVYIYKIVGWEDVKRVREEEVVVC